MHSRYNKIIISITSRTLTFYYILWCCIFYYNKTDLPNTGTIIINNIQENFTSVPI